MEWIILLFLRLWCSRGHSGVVSTPSCIRQYARIIAFLTSALRPLFWGVHLVSDAFSIRWVHRSLPLMSLAYCWERWNSEALQKLGVSGSGFWGLYRYLLSDSVSFGISAFLWVFSVDVGKWLLGKCFGNTRLVGIPLNSGCSSTNHSCLKTFWLLLFFSF